MPRRVKSRVFLRPLHRKRFFEYTRQKVFRQKGYRCWWCGGPAKTVDHIVPKARGGTDAYSNLAPACEVCNQDHGDLLLSEWVAKLKAAGDPRLERVSRHIQGDFVGAVS